MVKPRLEGPNAALLFLLTLHRSGGGVLLLLLLTLGPAQAAEGSVPQSLQQVQLTFAPVVRAAAPAVVNIFTREPEQAGPAPLKNTAAWRKWIAEDQQTQQNPLGSGVLVSPDGLIVTNEHVIHDAGALTIVLNDRREFDATVVRTDEHTDLALLKIDPGTERLPFLEIGDSDQLNVGDIVLAIGNPFGVGQTVTMGIVSALARTVAAESDERTFIQTDAAINPGNSGGALVDLKGELVGINTALYSEGGGSVGIGFAIPTALVRGVLSADSASRRVVRPWLGVTGTAVTVRMARKLDLPRVSGVYVQSVKPTSPLAQAGLAPGDIITAFDGLPVDDPEALRFRIDSEQIGTEATVKVWHDGSWRDISMKLMPPPEEPHRDVTELASGALAGITVANLSPALADELQVSETTGVIVLKRAARCPGGADAARRRRRHRGGQRSARDYHRGAAASTRQPHRSRNVAGRARRPAGPGRVHALMRSLFDAEAPRPLADRLRPAKLSEVVGQDHLLALTAPIGRMVAAHRLASMILWGPPGCGKTTIARLLAEGTDLHFEPLSAVFSGVADLRKVFEAARRRHEMGHGTLLFIDEIHRFNRAQQDSFLPYVEDGTVILVGATTENPSFELNGALLSRAQVYVLNRLDATALAQLVNRAEAALGRKLPLDDDARSALLALADGDGRYLINLAEELGALADQKRKLDPKGLSAVIQKRAPLYDKSQEGHYNLISALHKSMRGSDPDAALYWLARMLAGGEDPLYIVRRMVRFASEDIGMADPNALVQALAAWDTYERLGSPEGELTIAQAVVYLATAPKSVAVYKALGAANRAAKEFGSLMPPKHILNAPTKLMKQIGYGANYQYDPQTERGFSGQNYFPDEMERQQFYNPTGKGFEKEIRQRIDHWSKLRTELHAQEPEE